MTATGDLYEELGISREALQLYQNWNFNDTEKFTTDVMRRLTEQKTSRPLTGKTVTGFLKRFPGESAETSHVLFLFGIFPAVAYLWEKR